MRRKENPLDTARYINSINTYLYTTKFTQVDWEQFLMGLECDLENKYFYMPTAELALKLVKLKLNEFPNISPKNKLRLIQLSNDELYYIVNIIKFSPNFANIKRKIIKILNRSNVPEHKLASYLA